jgi:hypothetical protein
MIDSNDIYEFLNKKVDIGIPHINYPDHPFFISGIIKEIYDKNLKLQTKKGFRIIQLSEIIEIRYSEV